ncbi:MAG: competence type IV pilus major pilin ComGC [Liquorilactobacillus ghanensis]|jgi:competence protein ComGC
MEKNKARFQGFTLIEMSIVLFIIALLILIILPNVGSQRQRAQSVSDQALVEVVQTQANLYRDQFDTKSVSLDDLKKEGFLSEAQYQKAVKEEIKVKN